jgi:hypothetical protein
MSKGKIIGGVVVAVVVLAAIASAAAPKNTLAPTNPPSAGATSGAVASNPAVTSAAPSGPATYGVGDRVKLADEEYMTLEKAETGFTSDLVKPKAGNVNASFLVAFEGINPSGASYNPFYFKVQDEGGFEYNYNAIGKDPQLAASNDLKPGKIARGWMTFEVPKTAKTLTLVYTPGFTGEPVEFVYKP